MQTNRIRSLRIKRGLDVVFSILGILLFSPLLILIAFLVKTSIPGSVLYRQTRIGYKQKRFKILKFRSMKTDPDTKEDLPCCSEGRVPFVGMWIRRLKLDELPQLYNILIGDMSFIGPRPYIEKESLELPAERYSMRPGLTGLAQVNGNRELGWDERTAYDIDYVRSFGFLMDVKILMRTVMTVILGEKACLKHRET